MSDQRVQRSDSLGWHVRSLVERDTHVQRRWCTGVDISYILLHKENSSTHQRRGSKAVKRTHGMHGCRETLIQDGYCTKLIVVCIQMCGVELSSGCRFNSVNACTSGLWVVWLIKGAGNAMSKTNNGCWVLENVCSMSVCSRCAKVITLLPCWAQVLTYLRHVIFNGEGQWPP